MRFNKVHTYSHVRKGVYFFEAENLGISFEKYKDHGLLA